MIYEKNYDCGINTWLVYKVTYKNTIRYTALAAGDKELIIESTDSSVIKFRINKADINPQKDLGSYMGTVFLKPPEVHKINLSQQV